MRNRVARGEHQRSQLRSSFFRTAALSAAVVALALLLVRISSASEPPCPVPLEERQRYGFVAVSGNWSQEFDIDQLRAGWSVNFYYGGSAPQDMNRALVIRTSPGYAVNPERLGPLVDQNPGAIWLVGSEQDCIWQDNVLPEEYARIYHDVYTFIKSRDRTSQVAPGGIVQPTPLRLEYLDRVLAAYRERFGGLLPVDLWNIHNAILNEVRGSWGADIPPGIEADEGAVRSIDDNDNIAIFQEQIWAFRQWMSDRGYAGYPLIVTEFGVLMPELYGFDTARVNAFMSATFDFLQNTTDPLLGDPNDGYRLVQRWAWFSLDDQPWDPITGQGFNGNLFDPDTKSITPFGLNYADHTTSFPPLSYVDLGLSAWQVSSPSVLLTPTQTITHTLRVKVANIGTSASGEFETEMEYRGPVSATQGITLPTLLPASSHWFTFTLSSLQPGVYTVTVKIDPSNHVVEMVECNNQMTTTILVATKAFYLPVAARRYAAGGHGESTPQAALPSPSTPEARAAATASGFHEFEVPTPASYPGQIEQDAEGKIWVTQRDGNKIASYDPQSESDPWTEYDIPTPDSRPWGLAVDAGGNVWFAETAANKIGRLDVGSGTLAEYPIPTPNSEPWDVAIDDAGTVWFTERAGNKIGKLVPGAGVTEEYAVPTANAQPGGIATFRTHVWFTEIAANRLGWLSTRTEDIREFEARPPFFQPLRAPQSIVVGSAGNPWFTETEGNRIDMFFVSTLQDFLQVPVQTANSEPYGIDMEGDVAVWFTERVGNKIGRFTGSLQVPEYALPTPDSSPTDIVVDAAGCAWYTAPAVNRIGRLCPLRTHLPLILRE